jgi:hypothetical protein
MTTSLRGALGALACAIVSALAIAACSGASNPGASAQDAACSPGSQGCACYGNGTCNSGLACIAGVCTHGQGQGHADGGSASDAAAQGTDASENADEGAHDGHAANDATSDSVEPDAVGLDANGSDATAPDASASDVLAPDAARPDATGPDAATPDATGLDAPTPDAATGDAAAADAPADAIPGDASSCVPDSPCTVASPDPCAVYATDCSTGQPLCVRIGNRLPGHACGGGNVCNNAGMCVACVNGGSCVPASSPCFEGTLDCSTQSCVASTTALANGTSCGSGAVCDVGVCVACVSNQPCTPTAGVCVQGRTDCSTGVQSCVALGPVPDGTTCGPGDVCSAGVCTTCTTTVSCTPTNPCHTGRLGCGDGASCVDTGVRPDGTYCGVESMCTAGSCGSAGLWITRGEDNRTFTGGYIFSFATEGATVSPLTSTTVAFPPSPGGRTGNDLEVSGVDPVPTTLVYPIAALGWNFTATRTAFNAAALGSGIDLWIRSAYVGTIQVYMLDVWTDAAFGNCSTSPTAVDVCYNYPEHDCFIANQGVWTECTIPWASFVRQDWGTNLGAGTEVDATQVSGMQINVPGTSLSSLSSIPFDFAVDDVRFTP